MQNEGLLVTLTVTRLLEKLDVAYIVGGSFASTAYGKIRTTLDADIVAALQLYHVDEFIAGLGKQFYVDESAVRSAIVNESSFNLIHLDTFFKVDIFRMRSRPFDQKQIERGIPQTLVVPDGIVMMASPEDTVLAKLEWYQLGGEVSERQWRDVHGVLSVQGGRLDFDYLKRWAVNLGLGELLARALRESGLL
jgi:hypothetical protein